MSNIIFNFIYSDLPKVHFQSPWALKSKSEYMIENNIYDLTIYEHNASVSEDITHNQVMCPY